MPNKPGGERKRRRRARKDAEAAGTTPPGPDTFEAAEAAVVAAGGPHWALPKHGGGKLTSQAADNKLIGQSLRWATNATAEDFAQVKPEGISAKRLAVLVSRRNMLSQDPHIANQAVGNVIRMESQNQRDALAFDPLRARGAGGDTPDHPQLAAPSVNVVLYIPDNGRGGPPPVIIDEKPPAIANGRNGHRNGK